MTPIKPTDKKIYIKDHFHTPVKDGSYYVVPSVRPSACPSVRSPLMGTYWVGYLLLSTCSLFRICIHRTTQLILICSWIFCLLLGRNLLWEKPNKNTTVRMSVCPSVNFSCPRHNSDTVQYIFMKLGTNITHHQMIGKEQEPRLHLHF